MEKIKKRISRIGNILSWIWVSPLLIVILIICILYLLIKEFIDSVILRKPKLTKEEEYLLEINQHMKKVNEKLKRGGGRPDIRID